MSLPRFFSPRFSILKARCRPEACAAAVHEYTAEAVITVSEVIENDGGTWGSVLGEGEYISIKQANGLINSLEIVPTQVAEELPELQTVMGYRLNRNGAAA